MYPTHYILLQRRKYYAPFSEPRQSINHPQKMNIYLAFAEPRSGAPRTTAAEAAALKQSNPVPACRPRSRYIRRATASTTETFERVHKNVGVEGRTVRQGTCIITDSPMAPNLCTVQKGFRNKAAGVRRYPLARLGNCAHNLG